MTVYQYATSQTAGTALYDAILGDKEVGTTRFKNLLRAGGSDYPYNLLVEAGVDLSDSAPYRAAIRRMEAIMDEIERIIEVEGLTLESDGGPAPGWETSGNSKSKYLFSSTLLLTVSFWWI
jgi:hypothetical protein